MDINGDSLVERMREVLGKAPDRVLSFAFTGGCFRGEVYKSHAQVMASMEMVSAEVREGEEDLEWIRREKVRAMLKFTRMVDMEKKKEKELGETRGRMRQLKERMEKLQGMVSEYGDIGRLDVVTMCGCEGPCICIRSVEVNFQGQGGEEQRVCLDASSIMGAWKVESKDVGAGDGEVDPLECGDTHGEVVTDGNGNAVKSVVEEEEKIKITEVIFGSQDVREKVRKLQEMEVELARLRVESQAEVTVEEVEAREKVVEIGEGRIDTIVRCMERLIGERKYEEVMVEESRLWEEGGRVLKASPGGKLKDGVYRRWFEGRLIQGQAAVMLGRMPALYQVVGCEKKPLKQVPILGVRGLDEYMMSRWFLLRGIGRVEEGRYVEAAWDFNHAEVWRRGTPGIWEGLERRWGRRVGCSRSGYEGGRHRRASRAVRAGL